MGTKARYVRISHESQNEASQKLNKFDGKTYVDKCTGVIPFRERKSGGLLYQAIKSGKVNYVECLSLDWLGRDADDIQATIKLMKEKECQLVISEYGLMMFTSSGEYNNMFKLLTDLLANIAQMNRENIKHKQKLGIAAAKAKNPDFYQGRKIGSTEDSEKFLSKYKPIVSIIKNSNDKLTANAIAKMVRKENGDLLATPPTVRKIMKLVG